MVKEIKNCFLLVYHRHKTEEEISKCEDKESIGTEEPGRPQSIESQRVRHDWSDLAHTCMHATEITQIETQKEKKNNCMLKFLSADGIV